MEPLVRVRYAPSPTGHPHIGNVRTAMFNWLYARRFEGKFIVRIEDTDQNRLVAGAVSGILDALKWMGIDWDEGPEVGGDHGPYFQSERLDFYQSAVDQLIKRGLAYVCFCTAERLAEMRKRQASRQETTGYDRHCLNMSAQELMRYEDEGRVPVVRFLMPEPENITLDDLIRGSVTWQSELIDDFVILKSDGFPTYHLASVLDDHAMNISHVLRAEEWLPSTPRHLMLYRALGLKPPLFGHLPIILGPDRSKLSKRHGATSLLEYRADGYLPDALLNFMALLGWSLDDKTVKMSQGTLIGSFSLNRVVKAGAIFDRDKLDWLNGVYIRDMTPYDLTCGILEYWKEYPPERITLPICHQYLLSIIPLIQERIRTLKDAEDIMGFFFDDVLNYGKADLIQKDMGIGANLAALAATREVLGNCQGFTSEVIEECLRAMSQTLGIGGRQLFSLLRTVMTGRKAAPPLFQTMEVLGRERCSQRIARAITLLS